MKDTQRFNEVVSNAFDFLNRSIDELKEYPKFSVINFYTAIELLLKARLIKEHWSLIVSKPQEADRVKFQRGDFQSVGLEDANRRLKTISDDGIPDDDFKCFDSLRKERNQMVHFAHKSGGAGNEAQKAMDQILSEHAQGWLHLRRLLTGRWKDHFQEHAETINEMDIRMREQTRALGSKFLLLTDKLDEERAKGKCFTTCPSCQFSSFEIGKALWIGNGNCLTCGYSATVASVTCPNEICSKETLLDAPYDWCEHCERQYSPNLLAKLINDSNFIKFTNPQHGGNEVWANCGDCEVRECVAHLKTGDWFCTQCFTITKAEDIERCNWCNSQTTALKEDSMVYGCSECGGYAGHMADKDD